MNVVDAQGQSSSSAKKGARSPWSLWPRRRRSVVGVLLLGCATYISFVLLPTRTLTRRTTQNQGQPGRPSPRSPRPSPGCKASGRAHSDTLLLDNGGCRIPAHDALSAEVRPFVHEFQKVKCADPPPLVRSNDTALFVEHDLAVKYNASSVHCCYTAMWRAPGPRWQDALLDGVKHANRVEFGPDCVPFETSAEVAHEFVRVTCKSQAGEQVYQDFHGFVPEKRPRGHPAGVSRREFVSEEALSVLIVGIDSVSRLNMERKMPLTRAYLHQLGAVGPMLGYNKVEDNTFPNLVPLLSGLSAPELRNACWPLDAAHFDGCPWVWERFNQQGYVNMFAEDTAWMGLFHYLKTGFVNQPTDYDARPLLYLGEKELGRGGGLNAKYCIGQRHQIEVLFDYSAKFVRAMATNRRKFFGLVWGTSLSHDFLNQPDAADALYERLLRDLEAAGVLNNTALIFMSDHGLRFGPVLATYQGHLENLLPALYVRVPDWVRRRYPRALSNLECNQRGLVTVFDLHETLANFMDLNSLEETNLEKAADRVQEAYPLDGTPPSSPPPRGVSLFVPVPGERTCEDAGISSHFCACQYLTDVDPKSFVVQQAASFVMQQINAMLAGQAGCARLVLDAVLSARVGSPMPSRVMHFKALQHEFQLQLRTSPGGALLSATVVHHVVANHMRLAGSVSRLNAYGSSSWCVNTTALRPLCYCTVSAPTTLT